MNPEEKLASNSVYGKDLDRWSRWLEQAFKRLEENDEIQVAECPSCRQKHYAPLDRDPLKRGCYRCGWNQT